MILRGLPRDLRDLVFDELDNLDLAVFRRAYLDKPLPSLEYHHVYHCISSNYIHLWVWMLCNCRSMIPLDWSYTDIASIIGEYGSLELIEVTHLNIKLDIEEVAQTAIRCHRQEVFAWAYNKRHMCHMSDKTIRSARRLWNLGDGQRTDFTKVI